MPMGPVSSDWKVELWYVTLKLIQDDDGIELVRNLIKVVTLNRSLTYLERTGFVIRSANYGKRMPKYDFAIGPDLEFLCRDGGFPVARHKS